MIQCDTLFEIIIANHFIIDAPTQLELILVETLEKTNVTIFELDLTLCLPGLEPISWADAFMGD